MEASAESDWERRDGRWGAVRGAVMARFEGDEANETETRQEGVL